MKINDFHHVAIICSDFERSKEFYTKVLGCVIIEETKRPGRNSIKLDLKIGNSSRIELFSFPNPPKRVDSPEACGLRHLALEVDDVKTAVEELRRSGVETEAVRTSVDGKSFTFFKDPDGLPIEIYER